MIMIYDYIPELYRDSSLLKTFFFLVFLILNDFLSSVEDKNTFGIMCNYNESALKLLNLRKDTSMIEVMIV